MKFLLALRCMTEENMSFHVSYQFTADITRFLFWVILSYVISNFPLSVSNKTTNITNWWFRSRLRCLFSFQSVLDCVELYLLLHNFKTCANIRNTSARKLWSKILLNKFPFLLASQHHFILINAPSPFFRSIPDTFFPFLRLFKVFKTMLGFLMPIKRQY